MVLRGVVVAGVFALLAGCAGSTGMSAPGAVAMPGETIRYETSACYGTCPVYAVTVRADGTGTFEGERHTAVAGTRVFEVTPAQYRAFAGALAPLRPEGGERRVEPGSADCGAAATDAPSVTVRWSDTGGAERRLVAYFGCTSAEAQAARERLRGAPDTLPIAAFIGPR